MKKIHAVCVLLPLLIPSIARATETSTATTPEVNAATLGAVGNCTPTGSVSSCTDNTAVLQSAINIAYTLGTSVLLPVSPVATGQTVFYVAGTLNPKGVSIHGPIGTGIQNLNGYPKVIVRGAPGKDVFAIGDPTSSGYVNPNSNYTWRDFGIIVDDSLDVSATINSGHRTPGKTCTDVTVTNSSPTITSSECEFTAGDVGQAITVTDGINTLTTTISSVAWNPGYYNSPGQSATLAANWTYSSGSNRTAYLSLMGLPVTARVGNCALAYDNTTAASENPSVHSRFQDLTIQTLSGNSGTARNNSCGFFFQANRPYNDIFSNIVMMSPQWGFVATLADNPGSNVQSALGDLNRFIDDEFWDTYPFVSYDGTENIWQGGQIAGFPGPSFGPQILGFNNPLDLGEVGPGFWTIDRVEFEQFGASGGMGWRLEGAGHKLAGITLQTAKTTTPAQWDALASSCDLCNLGGTLNLAGVLNDLSFSNGSGFSFPSVPVSDTGFGNLCRVGWSVPPAHGNQQGALWHTCSGVNSRQNIAFAHNADFVRSGNETTPYNNQDDLWIWPQDVNSNGSGLGRSNLVADSTSESGVYAKISSAFELENLQGTPGQLTVGQSDTGPNLPATMVHVCVKAKADSGSGTGTFAFLLSTAGNIGSISPPLTTTYSTSCWNVNLASYTGQKAGVYVAPGRGLTVDLAWISMHPWPSQVQVTGTTQIGSSSLPITSSGSTCSMSSATTCTITVPSGSAHCVATVQGSTPIAGACSISGTTATITAASPNSATWEAIVTQ